MSLFLMYVTYPSNAYITFRNGYRESVSFSWSLKGISEPPIDIEGDDCNTEEVEPIEVSYAFKLFSES